MITSAVRCLWKWNYFLLVIDVARNSSGILSPNRNCLIKISTNGESELSMEEQTNFTFVSQYNFNF